MFGIGFDDALRTRAAQLYDVDFGDKFNLAIPSDQVRLKWIECCINPDFCIAATQDGQLVGFAGFQTSEGAFTDGMTYRSLIRHLGSIRGHWASLVFALYERKPQIHIMLMDGIMVDPEFRGQGIGTKLLLTLADHARQLGFDGIRLDVIDTNPRARKLYQSVGFRATGTDHFPWLKWFLGFSASTTLIFKL